MAAEAADDCHVLLLLIGCELSPLASTVDGLISSSLRRAAAALVAANVKVTLFFTFFV